MHMAMAKKQSEYIPQKPHVKVMKNIHRPENKEHPQARNLTLP